MSAGLVCNPDLVVAHVNDAMATSGGIGPLLATKLVGKAGLDRRRDTAGRSVWLQMAWYRRLHFNGFHHGLWLIIGSVILPGRIIGI